MKTVERHKKHTAIKPTHREIILHMSTNPYTTLEPKPSKYYEPINNEPIGGLKPERQSKLLPEV